MLKKLAGFRKRPFFRNMATVATGTICAQALGVVFSPILTRLYGPEAFGMLGVFTATYSILIPVATLTYAAAIVLPAQEDDAICLAKLSFTISLVMSVVVALLFIFFKNPLVALLKIQEIDRFVFLIPVVVFFLAYCQILEQWLIRKKQFKTTAIISVSNNFYINSAKSGVGLAWPTSGVLITLATLGSFLNALQLTRGARRCLNVSRTFLRFEPGSFQAMKALAAQYRDFPFFRAPQIFLNTFAISLPMLILISLFGPAAAGFYSLGRRILRMPAQILGKSVGDVFYPRIAEAANRGENIQSLILRATMGLAAVAILPYGLVFLIGPWLFGFVFGSEWVMAGEYARWLSVWSFFAFINKPCMQSVPVLHLQGFLLLFEIGSLSLRVLALYLGYLFYKSDLVSIIYFCLVGVVVNILLFVYIIAKSGRKPGTQAASP